MPKHIVLCSDGTGNTPGKGRGTNVWKLYLAVDRHDHERDDEPVEHRDWPQIAFYDDGVGSEGIRILRLAGGAFGLGLSRNVRQLYETLVLHHEPGDRVYLFGFSRGAFTVRSLAGMICRCGLLDARAYLDMAPGARSRVLKRILRTYRSEDDAAAGRLRARLGLRTIPIELVGVWDTVDAVGTPFDELKLIDRVWRAVFRVRLWGFHDQVLSSKVRRGCQALAIDDQRRTFLPNVWEPREGIEQVWFAGVHSNVGGGYPKEGLANVALSWMLRQARDAGLRLVPAAMEAAHDHANAYAKLYDSRAGLAVYYRYTPRDVARLCGRGPVKVHVTALDRIRWAVDDYAPTNLPPHFEVVDPDARVKGGVKRRVEARQRLVDGSAAARSACRDEVAAVSRKRARLYYAFLGLSLAVLAVPASVSWDWQPAADRLTALSASLEPVLGWTRPAVTVATASAAGLLELTAGVVVPGFLEAPIRSFARVPELTTVLVVCGLLLVWRRQVRIGRMRRLGEQMWRARRGGG